MTLSDRAIAICREHYHQHDVHHTECKSCPIDQACHSAKCGSQQTTDEWKLRVNNAAEMVQ